MSYSENGSGAMAPFTMPVAPAYGGMNDGFGFGGNGAWWLIILLLFFNNGGWGFGGYGNGMGGEVQRGFDQSAVMNSLGGINTAINNGFANAEISRCNGTANIVAGLSDLKYAVATENCADRNALSEGLTAMMMANNANTQNLMNTVTASVQSVMDKICQLELNAKNDKIADLQAQLNEANRRASQENQTAQILASQAAQTAALEQYLAPTPRPAYIVQNPNCCGCGQTYGCGCAA